MDSYKIVNFKKENPNGQIDFLELNQGDSNWMKNQVLRKLMVLSEDVSDTQTLFKTVDSKLYQEIVYKDDIEVELLKKYFNSIQVQENSIVGIIWDFESNVDIFLVKDLLSYWEDIWYDSSDEAILIFIPSMEKVLLLTDHGHIKTN